MRANFSAGVHSKPVASHLQDDQYFPLGSDNFNRPWLMYRHENVALLIDDDAEPGCAQTPVGTRLQASRMDPMQAIHGRLLLTDIPKTSLTG
jgi:hypothetical protein